VKVDSDGKPPGTSAAGTPKRGTAGKLTAKAELLKALHDSFEVCDAAWASTNDENAKTMVKRGNRELTRLGVLIYNTTHDNETYGTMVPYMRLKGIVPPSSEPRGETKKQ